MEFYDLLSECHDSMNVDLFSLFMFLCDASTVMVK